MSASKLVAQSESDANLTDRRTAWQAAAATVGAAARERLSDTKARFGAIGDVRGRGLLLGVEMAASGGKAPDPALEGEITERALDLGLSFKATTGTVLTLTPPLTITRAQMADALDRLEQAIAGALAARR